MPDTLGTITVPEIGVSGTFPSFAEYPFVTSFEPQVVTHQFGSANAKIEQRFYLGSGARRYLVRRSMGRVERQALRDFWEARSGPYEAFTFNAPNLDGTTTARTCRFENAPLSFDFLTNAIASVGVVLVEIPTSSPTYTLNSTQTRFPSASLPAALLAQVQEIIPLVKLQPRAAGYPAIYVSDRRCTVGSQLYLPRLVAANNISQSIGNESDEADFVFGNADRVMTSLANTVDLWRSVIEYSLFHVGQGIKLDLWRGEVIDWELDAGPEFALRAADGIHELTLPYPKRRVDRGCWKPFDSAACPYSSAGSGGNPASCDKGFDTANGCVSHGMRRYFGGIIASPQGVRIRDNANGGRLITATSVIGDSAYSNVLQEVYTNVPLPVSALVIGGRDEGEFYDALGIVGEGPLGAFDPDPLKQLLDNQPPHGPAPLGLRTSLGQDPAPVGDRFILTDTGAPTLNIYAAGTAFLEIRRTDQKGIQPTPLSTHTMQATVSQGLSGWVWSAPGSRTSQVLTNPVWIAINALLRARGLNYSSASVCEEYFDVNAAIAAAAICDATVTKTVGSGTETQFRFIGTLKEEKPLRDWIQEILMTALGYYTFAFGRLKAGIRLNSSVVEAFTVGNILFNSLRLKPIRPSFNHITANFADEEFAFIGNSVTAYDIDNAQLIGGAVPLFLKSQMNLAGCPSKSQAVRVAVTRMREELGGHNLTQQRKARAVSFRTTVLALNVEPGMVCSMTHPDMPDGAGEFRVTSWKLNPDYSIEISGRTTTDEMYDLTVGPKPADVNASPIPGEIGFSTLPVQPWGPAYVSPAGGDPLFAATEKTFGLTLFYEALADVGTLAKIEVRGFSLVNMFAPLSAVSYTSVSTSTSGGSIGANKYVTAVIVGVDADGLMTPPSTPVTVRVGAGSSNKITFNGVTWPAGIVAHRIFASEDYGALTLQVDASGTAATIDLTSIANLRGQAVPSSSARLLRLRAKRIIHSGVDGLRISALTATTIQVDGISWTTNQWAGRVVSIITDISDGSAEMWNYTVVSNTADTLTFSAVDLVGAGIDVDDVFIIRTKATSFSTTTIGDALFENVSYPAGMTVDAEVGLQVRIIGGKGKGQVRRIVSNTSTVHTVDRLWDVTPDSTSIYIVEEPSWAYSVDSDPIENDKMETEIAMTLPVDNLLNQTILVSVAHVDKFGIESSEDRNIWREIYIPGDPGTVSLAAVGIAYA
jgi:hypothetical protein